MCGRYTLYMDIVDVIERWQAMTEENIKINWQPRYNLAPTQQGLVMVRADNRNILKEMKWGLIPYWAKDPKIGSRLINARVESLDEKPAFRESLKRRRCIIPADGFYEWQKRVAGKIPMRITLEDESLFGFAGLWDTWLSPTGEPINSYTIITTEAVDSIRSIHNRMPLILRSELEEVWLSGPDKLGKEDMKQFLALMRPEGRLRAYRVSPLVNKPTNDSSDCIAEVPEAIN